MNQNRLFDGKFKPSPAQDNDFERLLAGETMLISKTNQLTTTLDQEWVALADLSKLSIGSLQYAHDIACSLKSLGARRQLEQGRGILSLMESRYRVWATEIDDHIKPVSIVFNWFLLHELRAVHRCSVLFGNSTLLKPLSIWLTEHCNSRHTFPVLWSGVKLANYVPQANLLFILTPQVQPYDPINIHLCRETFA